MVQPLPPQPLKISFRREGKKGEAVRMMISGFAIPDTRVTEVLGLLGQYANQPLPRPGRGKMLEAVFPDLSHVRDFLTGLKAKHVGLKKTVDALMQDAFDQSFSRGR